MPFYNFTRFGIGQSDRKTTIFSWVETNELYLDSIHICDKIYNALDNNANILGVETRIKNKKTYFQFYYQNTNFKIFKMKLNYNSDQLEFDIDKEFSDLFYLDDNRKILQGSEIKFMKFINRIENLKSFY